MVAREDAAAIHDMLMTISAKLERQNKKLVSREFEQLTMAEVRALIVLRKGESRPMGSIAGMLNVAVSTATTSVDRLVTKRLAQRRVAVDDRRKWLVSLTARGRKLVAEIEKQAVDGTERFLASLSRSDVLFLKKILAKIDSTL